MDDEWFAVKLEEVKKETQNPDKSLWTQEYLIRQNNLLELWNEKLRQQVDNLKRMNELLVEEQNQYRNRMEAQIRTSKLPKESLEILEAKLTELRNEFEKIIEKMEALRNERRDLEKRRVQSYDADERQVIQRRINQITPELETAAARQKTLKSNITKTKNKIALYTTNSCIICGEEATYYEPEKFYCDKQRNH